MSKHNYSQYANKNRNYHNSSTVYRDADNAPQVEEVKMVVERSETAAVNAQSVEPVVQQPNPQLVQETVKTVEIPKTVTGVVANCAKLNVRMEPNTDSDVVCVLNIMSEFEIDVEKSNKDWFHICTATGIEGYCMRKFVDAHL